MPHGELNWRNTDSGGICRPIQLPVEALLKQFKDPEAGGKHALIRNFDLMYIQQGIGRIETKVLPPSLPPRMPL